MRLTLVGVPGGTSISLDAIRAFVQTLSTSRDGDSIVIGVIPCLLIQSWVALPNLLSSIQVS
jgi:hypothetical protein